LEQLRTRLAEAEAVAASGSTQVGEWERERDLLAAELREAAAGEQRAQEELRAATERAAAATEADLQRALATARAAEEARAAANAAHTRLEEALAREAARRAAGEAPVAATAVPRQPARGPVHVVVVDDDPGWAAAAGEGRQVTVVPAGDAALESLGATSPTCVVVNLAARGALAALATLREAGSSARVWGCLATPATGLALPLGLVEPVARPVAPD